MKNWREELTVGKSLVEVKIQRGIFQGDVLLSLLFVLAMMLLNHIRNAQADTYFINRKKKNQPTNVRGRHQTVSQNEKELETQIQTVRIYSEDIGTIFGIEKFAMHNGKRKTANDERNRSTKSRKNQKARRKVN